MSATVRSKPSMNRSPSPADAPPPTQVADPVRWGYGLTHETLIYVLRDRAGRKIGMLEVVADLAREQTDAAATRARDVLDPAPALRLVE